MKYKVMKKWDGEHIEIKGGFESLRDANDAINNMIAHGTIPAPQSENREYYIFPDDEKVSE